MYPQQLIGIKQEVALGSSSTVLQELVPCGWKGLSKHTQHVVTSLPHLSHAIISCDHTRKALALAATKTNATARPICS